MKKFFETLGFISLLLFSLFYTDRIKNVIKENDTLLQTIKTIELKTNPIDAVVKDDSIIPGVSGSEIDVEKSYRKMKQVGYFNDNLLVYKSIKPNVSIIDNKDKYINRGNSSKRMVGLIFKVNNGNNIDNIIDILNQKNIKATFFTDGYWFEKNNDKIEYLILNKHTVGNLGYNLNYEDKNVTWMDTIINRVFNQKYAYCYGKDNLGKCKDSFTIEPTLEVLNNPLLTVENNLESGYIISLEVNGTIEKELPLIVDYIKSKGLELVNLETLLQE